MDHSLWENLTKIMCSSIGAILQSEQRKHHPATFPGAQAGRRDFYSEWALTALMGYAPVYKESGIRIIWGKLQIAKECSDNLQELIIGMIY